jgi:DHA1 family multidrug resistance protein-like MFS transporter
MTDPTPQPQEAAFPHWRRNRAGLPVAAFFQSIGFTMASPFLPLILREMGVVQHVETWVGYLLGIYFLLSFSLTTLWGAVADHYGRKLMVLRTSLGMGLVYLLLPFAPSLWWFLPIFLLLGTTNGFIPACQALVATTTPHGRLGSALSRMQTGQLVGGMLGPVLAAAVAGLLPAYRDLYWLAAGLSLLAGLIALVLSREDFVRPPGRLELNPVRDLRVILRQPDVWVLYLVFITYTLSLNGSVAVVSVYTLRIVEQGGPVEPARLNFWLGMVAVALPVGAALAVPFWGRLLDKIGPQRVLPVGLASGAAAVLLMALVRAPWQIAAARLLLGGVAVCIGPAGIALVKARTPTGMDSRVLAWLAASGMLGMGLGPLLAGLVGPWLGLRVYFALNAALVAGGLLLWQQTRPRAHSG